MTAARSSTRRVAAPRRGAPRGPGRSRPSSSSSLIVVVRLERLARRRVDDCVFDGAHGLLRFVETLLTVSGPHTPMGYHGHVSRYEVIVIGAGQAGLAVGYHLAQQERHFTILDAAVGAGGGLAPTLGLAEPVHARALRQPPRPAFPAAPAHHPSRDEVVAYLTRLRPPLRAARRSSTAASTRCERPTAATSSSSKAAASTPPRSSSRPARSRSRDAPRSPTSSRSPTYTAPTTAPGRRAGRPRPGGRRREHRLPARAGARGDATTSTSPSARARRHSRNTCSAATSSTSCTTAA